MAEFSMWWTTGGAGDGAATYTRSDHAMWSKVLASCNGMEGVAPNYLNKLVGAAGGANTVNIGTGGALVDGKIYNNSAAVAVNIPSAVGGGNTRIDRIVLRANWTAQTVRITRIAGTDAAAPVAPAITQSSGTTYDILLCRVLVDTAGAVTVTDERTLAQVQNADLADKAVALTKLVDFAALTVLGNGLNNVSPPNVMVAGTDGHVLRRSGAGLGFGQVATGGITDLAVTSAKLAASAVIAGKIATGGVSAAVQIANDVIDSQHYVDGSIDTAHIGDSQVTAQKIANRTRTFLVPANTYGTGLSNFGLTGLILPNGNNTVTLGIFAVPSDFVSGMTVSPIVNPDGSGNLAYELSAYYAAIGENDLLHSDVVSLTTTPCTNSLLKAVPAVLLTEVALGDFVRITFRRMGLEATDTLEAVVNLYGYLVTYTADS